MPSKEIKELRQTGKLEEALNLAMTELQAEPDNIWAKRNISWVYYDYLKQNALPEHFDSFILWLTEIANLNLPEEEKMLFDHLAWQIGSLVFKTFNPNDDQQGKMKQLLGIASSFYYTRPSEGYSFLFKAFHKAFKDKDTYLQFADWWDFENFRPEDYEKEKLPNGKEIMAIAEQAFIAYAKNLLVQKRNGQQVDDKMLNFSDKLSNVIEIYPKLLFLPYFKAKILLAQGDQDNMLSALLPFARKKQNEFWVWDILAEAFPNDAEKTFSCYCKALSCKSPEEMLVSVRQKMAYLLIERQLFNEAKTEIDQLIQARNKQGYKIPEVVIEWTSKNWFTNAISTGSNLLFYKNYTPLAESILYGDIPETNVIVEFINSDKKILNFMTEESKTGFLKYDRFINKVSIGDVLKIRFQLLNLDGPSQVYTMNKTIDEDFRKKFIKIVEGAVQIKEGKNFGFIDDAYIHPSIVKKHRLSDGMVIKAETIKTFNDDKQTWGWKVLDILN